MRNSAGTVADTIRSLRFQSLAEWELILVDDGSSDNSTEVVEAFGDQRIRILREVQSEGLAARLNQAIAAARAPFIARMDADDICFPQRLSRQLDYMVRHPKVELVAANALVFDDTGSPVGFLCAAAGSEITARPFAGFGLPHPTWFGRSEWFKANPYDPAMKKAEDQDLMLRTYRHSRFDSMSEVLLGYRQSRLDLKKLLGGRLYYARSLARHAGRGHPLTALRGVATHAARGLFDVATLAVGFGRWSQDLRLESVSEELAKEWQDVVRALDGTKLKCVA